jgi:hypothetical protein
MTSQVHISYVLVTILAIHLVLYPTLRELTRRLEMSGFLTLCHRHVELHAQEFRRVLCSSSMLRLLLDHPREVLRKRAGVHHNPVPELLRAKGNWQSGR